MILSRKPHSVTTVQLTIDFLGKYPIQLAELVTNPHYTVRVNRRFINKSLICCPKTTL